VGVGHAAGERGDGEQGGAGEEHALATEQVAEPAGEEEKAPVGDQVGADHPREIGLGEAQIALDDGESDVDDGHVDDHHQLTETDHNEGHPRAPVGAFLGRMDSHYESDYIGFVMIPQPLLYGPTCPLPLIPAPSWR
jgi:hypothetical protein